jgi:hypothetical protein
MSQKKKAFPRRRSAQTVGILPFRAISIAASSIMNMAAVAITCGAVLLSLWTAAAVGSPPKATIAARVLHR